MLTFFSTLLAQRGRIVNPVADTLSPTSAVNGASEFSRFVQTAVAVFFVTGILIFVLFFFIGAIKWILSSGDKGALQNAREAVLHAIIGLVILFSLYAVLKLIEAFLGVCIINIDLTNIVGSGQGSCTPATNGIGTVRDQYYLDPSPIPSSGRFGR